MAPCLFTGRGEISFMDLNNYLREIIPGPLRSWAPFPTTEDVGSHFKVNHTDVTLASGPHRPGVGHTWPGRRILI